MAFISLSLVFLGVLLMVLEIVIPGGVSFSLGLSFILVALGQHFGLISGFADSFLWVGILAVVTTSISVIIMKKFFSGKAIRDSYDEDQEDIGKTAKVVTDFQNGQGQIYFKGSTWNARVVGFQKGDEVREFIKDDKVEIVGRDNITWLIQRVKIVDVY